MKNVVAFVMGMVVAASALAEDAPAKFEVGAFEFQRPDGWNWVKPTSPMRKAELEVPGQAGEASVTFFHFGAGQGGGAEANIQRWVKQFDNGMGNAMQKTEQFGNTKVWFVTVSGTFQSGMPGGPTTPMEDYALRGAILESKEGDVFVKMTGPEAVVTGSADAFDAMVKAAASAAP